MAHDAYVDFAGRSLLVVSENISKRRGDKTSRKTMENVLEMNGKSWGESRN